MIRRSRLVWTLAALLLLTAGRAAMSQESSQEILNSPSKDNLFVSPSSDDPGYLPTAADPENRLLMPFVKHMVRDQTQFWASPKDLKNPSAQKTFAAFAGFTGLLVASDSWLTKQTPDKSDELARSRNLSDYATFSLLGAAGGAYVWGHAVHDDHLTETGFLAGEAALNSLLASYAFKEVAQRERPYQGNGHGNFFAGGISFPSEHSALAWSTASVIAHEYPNPAIQIAAYGLASAVTVTRITGREHFPSDAFVGSVLGLYLGRQVYRAHHDPDLGGAPWARLFESKLEGSRNPAYMGSPYVSLDSWVYPALTRLAALGYVDSAFLGMRPWTRMECARLLDEIEDGIRHGSGDLNSDGEIGAAAAKLIGHGSGEGSKEQSNEAQRLYAALEDEFREESARRNGAANQAVSLDAIYTRFTGISGTPLRDGYHFAQTIVNDFGRPYGEGYNQVSGVEANAVAGPFSFSFRGEYRHAPAVASDAPAVLETIALEDGNVTPLPDGSPAINRFRLIEGSVGVTLNDLKISFGKQNLWWGPGESGPLLMSDNAAPVTMLQIDNVSPFEIPLLSRVAGPVRMDFLVGQLAGQTWVYNPPLSAGLYPGVEAQYLVGPKISPQPFLHGNKIGFHPTANLEFGVGVTSIFGGPGLPFTWHEFLRSYYGHNVSTTTNPAKRFSTFDFRYRVPGLRPWLTVYMDSAVGDEITPIGSSRPMLSPGMYLAQLPKLHHLEFRAEGFKAEPRLGTMYIDRRYHSGYTNDGVLMGSWVGRQALGGEAWVKYSFTARSSFQLGYRHQEVDRYLAGGGRLNDFSATGVCRLAAGFDISVRAQYETWKFLALQPGPQTDFTAAVQLTFHPQLAWHRN
jgi:membrane-associated phospholipid phosphatase